MKLVKAMHRGMTVASTGMLLLSCSLDHWLLGCEPPVVDRYTPPPQRVVDRGSLLL